jgi:hypothetical protein
VKKGTTLLTELPIAFAADEGGLFADCKDRGITAQFLRAQYQFCLQSPTGVDDSELARTIRMYMHNCVFPFGLRAHGVGLYPLLCKINHSCMPNAFFIPDLDGQVVLYACHDIKQGEQITISYMLNVSTLPFLNRQDIIEQRLWFKCRCGVCTPIRSTTSRSRVTKAGVAAAKEVGTVDSRVLP